MRSARIKVHENIAGVLEEIERGTNYVFRYLPAYRGAVVSLTMPVRDEPYVYSSFPPFLDGLLPEGPQLDALLKQEKIDRDDLFKQLVTVGQDLVGAVTIEEVA